MPSPCGKSLAHITRSTLIASTTWRTLLSSWKVAYTFSNRYSLGRRWMPPTSSDQRWRSQAWAIRNPKCGSQPASFSTMMTRSFGWRSRTPPKIIIMMMFWLPRTVTICWMIFGPRTAIP